MARKELQITISAVKESVTLRMVGETHFDFDAAETYINEVMKHKPKEVVVDASGLTFISSIGMCFLINLRRTVKETSGALKIGGLQPLVRKALENAHVLHLFEVQPEAVAPKR